MLKLSVPDSSINSEPKIVVVGVGGAGGNAVNNMIEVDLKGVSFVCVNTDVQALRCSRAQHKIQIGKDTTKGLGAGANPSVGAESAEEDLSDVLDIILDANMVFITAGMGGGTGTGAAPVIAKAAREKGILTVGVVTKPFNFEGAKRMRHAEEGLEKLKDHVDTLIVIPNQNLFTVAQTTTTFEEAFYMADDVLEKGVRGITNLMVEPGIINLDFNDIKSVMREMGSAVMGTGEGFGEDRAVIAAEAAINNPLLDNSSMKGATAVLINVTSAGDVTLFEIDTIASRITSEVDKDANVIFGASVDETLNDNIRVTIVATGIDKNKQIESEEKNNKIEENSSYNSLDFENSAENHSDNAIKNDNITDENNQNNFDNNWNLKDDSLTNSLEKNNFEENRANDFNSLPNQENNFEENRANDFNSLPSQESNFEENRANDFNSLPNQENPQRDYMQNLEENSNSGFFKKLFSNEKENAENVQVFNDLNNDQYKNDLTVENNVDNMQNNLNLPENIIDRNMQNNNIDNSFVNQNLETSQNQNDLNNNAQNNVKINNEYSENIDNSNNLDIPNFLKKKINK